MALLVRSWRPDNRADQQPEDNDAQSARGKTPVGVAHIAQEFDVPVIALAGALGDGYEACLAEGITNAYSIAPESMAPAESFSRVEELLADAAEKAVRAFVAMPGD